MIAHQEEMHSVYIGLPGQNNMMSMPSQNSMPDNSMPSQQSCMPQTPHVIPPAVLDPTGGPHQVPPHQSPSGDPPHMTHSHPPQHHHPHITHQVPCTQLHTMPDHSSSLPPPANCLPHPPPYDTPLHRTDLSGTDCSGGWKQSTVLSFWQQLLECVAEIARGSSFLLWMFKILFLILSVSYFANYFFL